MKTSSSDSYSERFPAGFLSPEELLGEQIQIGKEFSVLVGFSGGADSTALLDALAVWATQSGAQIFAAHVNHGIRGDEAIRDREFCRTFCRDRNIPFFCLDTDVPGEKRPGESLETAARRIRYAFFEELMQTHRIPLLALAHHADDNLETVLFRLCRGTGLRGLCGIPPVRPFGCGTLIRPLIGVTKAGILRYCNERGLSYMTDSTNLETDAARNRIRMNVLPALAQVTGNPTAAVTRMTRLLRADLDYLEAETDRLIAGSAKTVGTNGAAGDTGTVKATGITRAKSTAAEGRSAGNCPNPSYAIGSPDLCRPAPTHLSRKAICGAPYAIASRAVARMYEAAGGDPGAVHIDALLNFCRSGTAHGVFPLPGNKNARVTVVYDDIRVEKKESPHAVTAHGDVRAEKNKNFRKNAKGSENADGGEARRERVLPVPAPGAVSSPSDVAPPVPDTVSPSPDAAPFSPDTVSLIPGEQVRFGRFTVSAEVLSFGELCRRFGADAFSRRPPEVDSSRKTPISDIQSSQCDPKIYNLSIRIPFKSDKIKGNRIYLRKKKPGDKIRSGGMHKDVRRLLSACRFPPALRGELPLLCDGDGVLALPFSVARDGTYPDRTTPPDLPVWLCSVTLREEDDPFRS